MTAALPASHWQTVVKLCVVCGHQIQGKSVAKGSTKYCDTCARDVARQKNAEYKARLRAGLVTASPDARLDLVRSPGDIWPRGASFSVTVWREIIRDDPDMAGAVWRDRRGNEWRVTDGKLQQAAG